MNEHLPSGKFSIGQALAFLRKSTHCKADTLYQFLRTSSGTYLKIERDEPDLSFLMALRICQFYELDIHEFITLDQSDISPTKTIRGQGDWVKRYSYLSLFRQFFKFKVST